MSFIGMYTLVVNLIDLSHISENLYFISHDEYFQCKVKDVLSLSKF